jgi:N-formylmethionyl-tRNA deformylase
MAIRPVLRMGNPVLNKVAENVREFDTPYLHQLIQDMRDTMTSLNGAGIAAPQIGVSQRVVIFGVQTDSYTGAEGSSSKAAEGSRYPDAHTVPETVLINPVIELLTDHKEGMWEGCLSVPKMRGYVERPTKIRYNGADQYGEPIDRTVDGFHAIVVQHECDHLDGILYPMRITDMTKFGFEEEMNNLSL